MPETVLQLKDASIYQGDSLVLSKVNFEMEKGDFVYLIGKTGTGKSSFMKTLYGDLELTEGEGNIVDFDLRALPASLLSWRLQDCAKHRPDNQHKSASRKADSPTSPCLRSASAIQQFRAEQTFRAR